MFVKMHAVEILLVGVLCTMQQVNARALLWDRDIATETNPPVAHKTIPGISKPTQFNVDQRIVDRYLGRRQEDGDENTFPDTVCGFIGGEWSIPATCSSSSTCVWDTAYNIVACAPKATTRRTAAYTTCFDDNNRDEREESLFAVTCSGVDECYRNWYEDIGGYSFSQWGCGYSTWATTVLAAPTAGTGSRTVLVKFTSMPLTPAQKSTSTTAPPPEETENPDDTPTTPRGGSSTTSSPPTNTEDAQQTSGGNSTTTVTAVPSSSNTGAIAGGVAGGVVALIALVAGLFFIVRRRKTKPDPSEPTGDSADAPIPPGAPNGEMSEAYAPLILTKKDGIHEMPAGAAIEPKELDGSPNPNAHQRWSELSGDTVQPGHKRDWSQDGGTGNGFQGHQRNWSVETAAELPAGDVIVRDRGVGELPTTKEVREG